MTRRTAMPVNPPATRTRTYPVFEPGREYSGKFLQLECDGAPWLLFATPDSFRYHNQLLARFLEDERIAHRWIDRETLEVPRDRARVTGGGRFNLNLATHRLDLWDDSHAYGRFDAHSVPGQLVRAGEPWCGLLLSIR